MTVAALEAQMSYEEFLEWIAFSRINPFGEWRDDLRIGMLGLRLAQVQGAKRIKLENFMPKFEKKDSTPKSPKATKYAFGLYLLANKLLTPEQFEAGMAEFN